MQARLIAVAAALAACGAAHALTPAQITAARTAGTLKEVYIAGASAQRLFLGAWMQAQCKATTFDVFFNGTGAAPTGSNHRAYSCQLSKQVGNWAAGTNVLLVKRDQGGSTQGVNPIATGTAQDMMVVDSTCTATGNSSPAADILVPSYACPSTAARLADAGVSDVEPSLLQHPSNLLSPAVAVDTSTLDYAAFNLTLMGVAVNKKLYRALQEAQGLISAGAALDDDAAKQPSLNRAFVASVLSGTASGSSTNRRGWNVVIPTSVDSAVESKQINICRRNIGSGTQAASNIYFLEQGCAKTGTGNFPVTGQTVGAANSTVTTSPALAETGTLAWNLGSSAGAVETCLGTTVEGLAGTAYGIGVISRENNPTPSGTTTDKGYRFVKLNGVAPLRDNGKAGAYDFMYAATMQWSKTTLTDANVKAFLTNLRTNGGRAASLNVADVDTQQGVLALPSTYGTAYAAITDAVTLKFASRVARNAVNSCAPLVSVK
jgi:hypothetical protein